MFAAMFAAAVLLAGCLGAVPSMPAGAELRHYRVGEVAKIVDRSERSVWGDIATGRLKVSRFGRSVRVHPDDLKAYLDGARSSGGAQ